VARDSSAVVARESSAVVARGPSAFASRIPPRVILLIGGALFLLYAYPGLMTLDSVDQLTEARAGFYTDAHPPAMAALWRLLDAIIAGPFLMLLIQGIAFLAGTYLVLARAMSPRKAAVAAGLVLLFPPILTSMAFIWKDSLMAGMLVLGAGLVPSRCRIARFSSLACFALATAVKYNAFAATFPLIVLLFEWRPGAHRWLVRYAIAAAAWLAITFAAVGANTLLVDQPMHLWHSTFALEDIVGVITFEGPTSDEELRRDLANTGLLVDHDIQQRARDIYATRDLLTITLGDKKMWDMPTTGTVPAPESQRDAVAAAWWRMVSEHPGAYFRHRLSMFLDVTGVTYKSQGAVSPRIMKYPGFLTNLGLPATTHAYQDRWWRFHKWFWRVTPLFRQWLYIALAIALLPLCIRRNRDIAALCASGLLIEASLFFLSPSPDYRYSHWTIVTACLGTIMLVSRRRSRWGGAARDIADTPAASPRDARAPRDRG